MKLATPEKITELYKERRKYQRLDNFKLSEPRLEMIYNRLRALLEVIHLESNGKPVDVDAFRLKNLNHWTSKVGPAFSDLWFISTACNMRCPFCYEEGDPFEGSVLNEPTEMISELELETRIKYRDYNNGTGIFQPLTYINEIFCHPKAMDIIERIRLESPNDILTFVTNGTYLTEEVIGRLAKLKPIFFNFSVNSLNPEIRRKKLRDLQPEIAIEAIDLLKKYQIPYLGSLVCWPTIPWEDIENTIRILDESDCAIIRFSLSSYSKFLKGRRFDREAFWEEGIALAKRMMQEVQTPIKIEPYHYAYPTFLPYVAGVIKGSPAWKAGIKPEDLLIAINDINIPSANHALVRLAKAYNSESSIKVTYMNDRMEKKEVVLENNCGSFGYPFNEMKRFAGFEYGLIIVDNLKFGYFKTMRTIIDKYNAKRVLLCSSEIMKPIVLQMLKKSMAFEDIDLMVEVPENKFFGGTVVLGDLLVVQDYIDFINEYQEKINDTLDLVLIPSSPFSRGEWLRDLTGVPYTEIERRTGLNVELINCKPING